MHSRLDKIIKVKGLDTVSTWFTKVLRSRPCLNLRLVRSPVVRCCLDGMMILKAVKIYRMLCSGTITVRKKTYRIVTCAV